MDAQILAHLRIGERTFEKRLILPVDPAVQMKLALTCEDSERKVFAEIDVWITDLIFIEKENRLICNMRHCDTDDEAVLTSLFESDNWGVI